MRKILFVILFAIPLGIYAQFDLLNFAADQLGVSKSVVQGAEIIGGLYNVHRTTTTYEIKVDNKFNVNINMKDPQALLNQYNQKIDQMNSEFEVLRKQKEKEINDHIDKIAKTAANLAKDAGVSTGNGLLDLVIEIGGTAIAKGAANNSAEKQLKEAKDALQKEMDDKMKTAMSQIKTDIITENTNAKNEFLVATAKCFSENDEKYYVEHLKYHDCVISEIEKKYDWRKADWINTTCSAPSKIKPYSSINEKNDYITCAKRKYKIYQDQFKHESFLESARNFTESALSENPRNSEAYAFLAYLEKDLVAKYKFISFAHFLNPGNNKIAEEKKITAFYLSKHFFDAIKNNNIEFVKKIADLKFHYGMLDREKNNPIAATVNSDKAEILDILLASYPKPDLTDIFFYSVAKESNLCIKKLLDKGLDISKLSKNSKGQPLFFIAASRKNQDLASMFLDKNVNIDLSLNYAKANNFNDEYKTMLLYTMDKAIEKSNMDYYNKVIKILPEIYNEPKNNTENYFQYAIKMNCKAIVFAFLEKGVPLNSVTSDGRTNLQIALYNNAPDVAIALIEKGFDLTKAPSTGGNYLNVATSNTMPDVLKVLIDHQQSPNMEDKNRITPMMNCIKRDDLVSLEFLINNKANIDESGDFGNLLHLAINNKTTKILEFLISKGVSPNVVNTLGNTPLMHALIQNKLESAPLIVKYTVDLNIQNKDKWSPLSYSICKGYNDIAKLIIEKGADLNIKCEHDWTPLHYAVRNNNVDLVSLLVSHNADKKAKDKWSRTPLKIADQMNYTSVKSILK